MNVFLQILKVNEVRSGIGKTSGNPYRMQDCECLILDDKGDVDQVGVLMLSKDQVDKTFPGIYLGSFAMRANTSEKGGRKIEAVLTALSPVRKTAKGFVSDSGEVAAPIASAAPRAQ
jgi:hypothetical protein